MPLNAKVMQATYITHTDGDTVLFQVEDKRLLCQLDGIDAPELRSSRKLIHDSKRALVDYDRMQALGMDAFVYLRNTFIRGVTYTVDVVKGHYQNVQRCMVYLPGHRRSLNERAVMDGYAVMDRRSIILKDKKRRRGFIALQQSAAADRAGLWKEHYNTMAAIRR
jgi:endonuclease YncB( thermonuclease family)